LLAQAVHNIVHNAIEAMQQGGTLHVASRRENGSCSVYIEDTGPGISDEAVRDIFEPFFSTKETGMGLGLTMARRIVQQHDGSIQCINDGTSGGHFRITLPASVTQAEPSHTGA
jgi:signal transduction histidine kinase